MINQGSITSENQLFTCWLGGWRDAGDAEGRSWYTFGFIDQDAVRATGSDVWYTGIDNSYGF